MILPPFWQQALRSYAETLDWRHFGGGASYTSGVPVKSASEALERELKLRAGMKHPVEQGDYVAPEFQRAGYGGTWNAAMYCNPTPSSIVFELPDVDLSGVRLERKLRGAMRELGLGVRQVLALAYVEPVALERKAFGPWGNVADETKAAVREAERAAVVTGTACDVEHFLYRVNLTIAECLRDKRPQPWHVRTICTAITREIERLTGAAGAAFMGVIRGR